MTSMGSDPHSTYKSTQIETASQEQILLMLYDGCIKYTRQAKKAMQEDDHKTSHNKLIQAQDIVTELMSTLDMEVGGEVAEELYQLYDFVLHNLIQANVDKDPERIDDVLPVLEELNDTWDEVINEKGMTVEKARRQVGQTASSGSDTTGGDSEPDVDPGDVQTRDPSQTPDTSSDSFEGNVTYGDI
jgi:flagellar protein FliS